MAYALINDINLYYEIHGSGEPLLLLPGLGSATANWLDVIGILSKNYQVIIFNYRGSGLSTNLSPTYDLDELVQDIYLFLEHLNLSQVNIIGHSLGGMVAQRFVFLYPGKVLRLILYATSRRVGIFMRQALRLAMKIKQAKIRQQLTGKPSVILKMFKSSNLVQDTNYASLSCYIQNAKIAMRFNGDKWLKSLSIPTLIIFGNRDLIFPLFHGKKLKRKIRGSQFKVVKGYGHCLHVKNPSYFCKYLLDFLQKDSI